MDKLHQCLIAGVAIVALSGCSAKQSQQLGMRSNTVTKVSQQMSNLELCETYLYGRSTTQTHFAIASEWSRRGLSRKYCEETINQLYISAWASWLVANKDKKRPTMQQNLFSYLQRIFNTILDKDLRTLTD